MSKLPEDLSGVWSASPTPFTKSYKIDQVSLRRLVRRHIDLGVKGIFLGGSCGEGPYIKRTEVRRLIGGAARAGKGKIIISVQVTDNSFTRVLDNIAEAKAEGADIAVLAEPWFRHALIDPNVMEEYYLKTLEKTPLPIGLYLRTPSPPLGLLRKILMHPNVCMAKNSAMTEDIWKLSLQIPRKRTGFAVMTGAEFGMDKFLKMGITGVVAGGGVLIAKLLTEMIELARQKQYSKLPSFDKHCNRILRTAYGGPNNESWLTGFKYTLAKMGIFRSTTSYLDFPFPRSAQKRIDKMLDEEQDILLPS